MAAFPGMITFEKRLGIYVALWLIIALACASAPFPPTGHPMLKIRLEAFFTAPSW